MKLCTKCKETKPYIDFNKKGKGLQSYCKNCQAIGHSKYYTRNKDSIKTRTRARRKKYADVIDTIVSEYLNTHPCIDCGETDIQVLEFDHMDPSTKSFCISYAPRLEVSLDKLQKEIQKCEIRCANCHRRKTRQQLNYSTRNRFQLAGG